MFIDTHCHLDFPPFVDKIANTLSAAKNVGIVAMIVPAVTASRFAEVRKLADNYPMVYGALGLHPVFTHSNTDLIDLDMALATRKDNIVAVGEIGLDSKALERGIDKQIVLLLDQLYMAKQYHLPVILHSRRHTHDMLYKQLKKVALPHAGVIHGFSGSYMQAMQFIALGYKIGVGGTITYARANKTRHTMARIPLTSIVLETDAPDMPLYGFQGQPNKPEQIARIFTALCQLRVEDPDEIQHQIYLTSKQVFNLHDR